MFTYALHPLFCLKGRLHLLGIQFRATTSNRTAETLGPPHFHHPACWELLKQYQLTPAPTHSSWLLAVANPGTSLVTAPLDGKVAWPKFIDSIPPQHQGYPTRQSYSKLDTSNATESFNVAHPRCFTIYKWIYFSTIRKSVEKIKVS